LNDELQKLMLKGKREILDRIDIAPEMSVLEKWAPKINAIMDEVDAVSARISKEFPAFAAALKS